MSGGLDRRGPDASGGRSAASVGGSPGKQTLVEQVQRHGGHESDTMRAHRERDALHDRHGDRREPGTREELAEVLIRDTMQCRVATGRVVPLDYVARCLHARASHPEVDAAFNAILDRAGTTSWDDQMTALELGAPSVLHAVETAWVHDPDVSGLDVLGPRADRYRTGWHDDDYPDGPRGPGEGRARALSHDLDMVVPERRANQDEHAVASYSDFTSDAAMRAYIQAHLQPVPPFSAPLVGDSAVPTQPSGVRILDAALESFLQMRAAAAAQGVALVIARGWRSLATATAAAERADNPSAVAKFSSHTLGLAVDLDVGEERHTTPMSGVIHMRRSEPHRWMLLYAATWGWYPFEHEPWHWEYNPPGFRERLLQQIHPAPTAEAAPSSEGARQR